MKKQQQEALSKQQEEVKKLRSTLVHKPEPITTYPQIEKKEAEPATIAKSPLLLTKQRAGKQ
jgi:hypothetical protein